MAADGPGAPVDGPGAPVDGPTPIAGRPVDLRADGLLWLINRVVFHPRGYALALDGAGNFTLLGDGREVWTFLTTEMERLGAHLPGEPVDEQALLDRVRTIMP